MSQSEFIPERIQVLINQMPARQAQLITEQLLTYTTDEERAALAAFFTSLKAAS